MRLCEAGLRALALLFQRGATSLIWASRNGHIETVRLLVESGADVGIADNVSV